MGRGDGKVPGRERGMRRGSIRGDGGWEFGIMEEVRDRGQEGEVPGWGWGARQGAGRKSQEWGRHQEREGASGQGEGGCQVRGRCQARDKEVDARQGEEGCQPWRRDARQAGGEEKPGRGEEGCQAGEGG